METYPSPSPSVSSSSSQTTSEGPQSSTAQERTSSDIAEPPFRVFRMRPTRTTLIRGTQTISPPSEPSTSNADYAGSSSEPAPETSRSFAERSPRKVRKMVFKVRRCKLNTIVVLYVIITSYGLSRQLLNTYVD